MKAGRNTSLLWMAAVLYMSLLWASPDAMDVSCAGRDPRTAGAGQEVLPPNFVPLFNLQFRNISVKPL